MPVTDTFTLPVSGEVVSLVSLTRKQIRDLQAETKKDGPDGPDAVDRLLTACYPDKSFDDVPNRDVMKLYGKLIAYNMGGDEAAEKN